MPVDSPLALSRTLVTALLITGAVTLAGCQGENASAGDPPALTGLLQASNENFDPTPEQTVQTLAATQTPEVAEASASFSSEAAAAENSKTAEEISEPAESDNTESAPDQQTEAEETPESTPATGSPSTTTALAPRDGMLNRQSVLRQIATRYQEGQQPVSDQVEALLSIANQPWNFLPLATEFAGTAENSSVYTKSCGTVESRGVDSKLPDMGQHLYARVLSYQLTGDVRYATEARRVLLDLAQSSGFQNVEGKATYSGANQCAHDLGLLLPLVVESALLLEAWDGWTTADRAKLKSWMSSSAYPLTAAIARTRKNNWGSAAAFASWAIAHYMGNSKMPLVEVYPEAQILSAAEARQRHLESQLRIIGNLWPGDSRCPTYGIQSYGGIPDELRRGDTGCDGTSLLSADRAYAYQITQVSELVFHAEALRRHGANDLFQQRLSTGKHALLQAILFVVSNPLGNSFDWSASNLGVLRIANHWYQSDLLCQQLQKGQYFTEGRYLPFTQLTHPDSC